MAEPFVGEIKMFAGNFAPAGYALCNGQLLSIQQNTALFSIIGTNFGGNGVTTFALPNLQSRVPIHQGTGPGLNTYIVGEQIGSETVTLLQNQMPVHNHLVNCDNLATARGGSAFGAGTGEAPSNNYPGRATSPANGVYSTTHNATMNASMLSNAGGGQPFSILQPVLCVTFIIALQGIYPSRN